MRHDSTASRIGLAVLLLMALTAAACQAPPERHTPDPDPSARVEGLRSLPYLGFSSEKAAAGSGVARHDPKRAYPGVNLYTSRDLCRADLVDMDGRTLKTWISSPCRSWANAELLADGSLVVPAVTLNERGADNRELARHAYLLRLGWDGRLVWRSSVAAHHDVELTPSGQFATLAGTWRVIPDYKPGVEVEDHAIALVGQDGTLLEQASLYDLLATNAVGFRLQEVALTRKPGIVGWLLGRRSVDLFHANTIEWMSRPELAARSPIYSTDNVLVTIRHQDTIAIIDWRAKRLVWAWGQGELSGPHDGTVLENGNILVFDNGLARGWSRVVELDPIAKKIVWEYKAAHPTDFFSVARGACQRFPNGNTLITNSDHGQAFEVTPEGEIVWEFLNPLGDDQGRRATIHRMRRYDRSFVDGLIAGRRPADLERSARPSS